MIAKDSTGTPISQRQWDQVLAERDTARALLRECRNECLPLMSNILRVRIDAALRKDSP